jgi:murein L,D-transpeptidase YafK
MRGLAAVFAVVLIVVSAVAMASGAGRHWASDRAVLSLASPRVVVLKSKRLLCLFDGDRLIRSYAIDLGSYPSGPKHRQGDGRTPLGTFRVVTRNAASPYHRFLGLDYPNTEAVGRGLREGLISKGEAASIRAALAAGRCPDWSTALGGGIGIHGRWRGSDWTAGCIALADENVEELFSVLRIGDPVEILP